jgi:hypothetical protein
LVRAYFDLMALMPFAAAFAAAVSPVHPCWAALPRGPVVPAAMILRTSCGGYRLAPSGGVTRLPRDWIARHSGGTGRRYGADIAVRRTRAGRFILLRHGRVLWRSHGLYYRTGDTIAFGPHLFAFNSYYRGVFLTDLRGPERLVLRGRGLNPYDFTRRGELLVTALGRVVVVARDGTVLRRYRFRRRNGFTFDPRTETVYFVSPVGTLEAAEGTQLRPVRRLRGIDGWITFARPGLLVFTGRRSVAITRLDGSLVARARWPRSALDTLDSGVSVSPDGRRFAFRLSNARPGAKRGAAAVYVLHSGRSRAHVIYRHRLGASGCAVGASMEWHGSFLLYESADGQRAILDAKSGKRTDLARFARALPGRRATDEYDVFWASDFPR